MKVSEIVEAFVALTPEQRIDALAEMSEKVCLECGDNQPGEGYCQCSNDE